MVSLAEFDRSGSASSKRYILASRFPIVWQTRLILVGTYATLLCSAAIATAAISTTGLKASRIPNMSISFHFFLLASAISTLVWLILSTQHFRVGVLGYKIAAPSRVWLFCMVALLWVPPFLYAYQVNAALQQVATEFSASSGYLKMQRAASLVDADSHYEPLLTTEDTKQLVSKQEFTSSYIRDVAGGAIDSLELFGPEAIRSALTNLMTVGIPNCARGLSAKSKSRTIAEIREGFEKENALAQTDERRLALNRDRALRLERVESDSDATRRKFDECVAKAMDDTNRSKVELVRGLRDAQRNAYLIQYAHKSFGPRSTDNFPYISEQKFAAPELSPFGFGDISIISLVLFIATLVSVSYVAGEYVEPSLLVTAIRNSVIGAMLLFLLLPILEFLSPISIQRGSHIIERWASLAHWPSLAIPLIIIFAVVAVALRTSTNKSRQTILIALLGLPLFFEVQTLNAINTLGSNDYAGGACPAGDGWVFADRIHCAVYVWWQPIVRVATGWIARLPNWDQFLSSAGARVTAATVMSVVLTFACSIVILPLLKREYVRPRDR